MYRKHPLAPNTTVLGPEQDKPVAPLMVFTHERIQPCVFAWYPLLSIRPPAGPFCIRFRRSSYSSPSTSSIQCKWGYSHASLRASYVVSGTKWTPYVTCADDIRCVLNWLKLRMTSSDDKEKTSEQTNVLFDPIPVSNRVDNRRRNYQLQVAFEKAKRKDPLVFVFQLLAWETNVATRNLRRVWNGGCWLLTLYL
jgi:hypothetical protein